jgi:hypothetical protein
MHIGSVLHTWRVASHSACVWHGAPARGTGPTGEQLQNMLLQLQLQGGDPPVQLQKPAWQSEMRDFRHALLASSVRPLAAALSRQALGPHGGEAFTPEARTPTPSASTANPMSILRATMG